jgi:hypothetical protein
MKMISIELEREIALEASQITDMAEAIRDGRVAAVKVSGALDTERLVEARKLKRAADRLVSYIEQAEKYMGLTKIEHTHTFTQPSNQPGHLIDPGQEQS